MANERQRALFQRDAVERSTVRSWLVPLGRPPAVDSA